MSQLRQVDTSLRAMAECTCIKEEANINEALATKSLNLIMAHACSKIDMCLRIHMLEDICTECWRQCQTPTTILNGSCTQIHVLVHINP